MPVVDPLAGIDLSQPAAPPEAPTGPVGADPLAGVDLAAPPARPRGLSQTDLWTRGAVVDSVDRGAGFLTTARASLAPNAEDQIKRFAAARGISTDRYGVAGDEIVYLDDDGRLVKEVPTVFAGQGAADTVSRIGRWMASGAGAMIPAMAGGVAGAVTGPTGMSIPAAGVAAAGGDVLRQGLDRLLAGESPTNVDWWNVAGQGALNATGQGAGVGIAKALQFNPLGVKAADRVAATDPAKLAEWDALKQEATARGVPLSVDELTGLQSLRTRARALRRFPDTTDTMTAFVRNRNTEAVPNAVRAELDRLGPAEPADIAVSKVIESAKATHGAAVEARTKAASPLYESAFGSGAEPDVTPVMDLILDHMDQVPQKSSTYKYLTKTRDLLGEMAEKTDAQGRTVKTFALDTDYRRLHAAKEEIDAMITDVVEQGNSADKRALRALTEVQKELTGTLRAAHPDYESGYQAFIAHSAPVDELRNGGVGVLMRKTGLEREQMLEGILNAQNITPAEVERTRNALQRAGAGGDWDAAVRTWLEGKLSAALKVNANAEPGNVPGKFTASIWGDPRQREIMRAALGDAGRVNGMERLVQVLQAAARTLPEGSQTATDMAAMNDMSTSLGPAARGVATALNPTAWARGAQVLFDAVDAGLTPRVRRQLAGAMLSDQSLDTLRKLQMLPPGSEKALALTTELLSTFGLEAGSRRLGLTSERDRAVPASGAKPPARR